MLFSALLLAYGGLATRNADLVASLEARYGPVAPARMGGITHAAGTLRFRRALEDYMRKAGMIEADGEKAIELCSVVQELPQRRQDRGEGRPAARADLVGAEVEDPDARPRQRRGDGLHPGVPAIDPALHSTTRPVSSVNFCATAGAASGRRTR